MGHREELYEVYNIHLDKDTQASLLRCKDGRISHPKKILGGSCGEKRPIGISRSRWGDKAQKDALFLLHIRNWKSVAQSR
jgi:hypothetical protein